VVAVVPATACRIAEPLRAPISPTDPLRAATAIWPARNPAGAGAGRRNPPATDSLSRMGYAGSR